MKRYESIGVLAAAAMLGCLVALSGCGTSNVSTVKTYEIVTNYDRMTSQYEPRVSLVYVAPKAKLDAYKTLVIKPVVLSTHWIEDKEQAELFRPYLDEKLKEAVLATRTFEKVVSDPQYLAVAQPDEKILVLESVVTRLDFGNGTARYFLQMGATDLQIEGRLIDWKTREPVVEFAERRRELGENPWDPSVKAFDNQFTLKQTVMKVTSNISGLLSDLRKVKDAKEPKVADKPAEAPAKVADPS